MVYFRSILLILFTASYAIHTVAFIYLSTSYCFVSFLPFSLLLSLYSSFCVSSITTKSLDQFLDLESILYMTAIVKLIRLIFIKAFPDLKNKFQI